MDTNEILDINLESDDKIKIESVNSGNFVLLFVLSLGLYGIWWMYKSWRFFKEKEVSDIMPVARAIFNIFFMYALFEKIQKYARSNGYTKTYSSNGLFVFYIITYFLGRLPDPLWLLAFLGVFCFLQPLNAFNEAIDKSDLYKVYIRKGFNNRQLALIIVGSLFWMLIIIGLLLPAETY